MNVSTSMRVAAETQMLGATLNGATTNFRVWAPSAQRVEVSLIRGDASRGELAPMRRSLNGDGIFEVMLPACAGDRYFYLVDGQQPVPDPVSRFLPEGVHGPSEIIDPADFCWTDNRWRGLPLERYCIYELHVGTFTSEGTFDAVRERLEYLRDLGITVIELMPVAAFPGERNWGYDGVSPYAVQASYGGPQALKRLVDAAHACGIGVMLDVVYNHLGNEGNYLRRFGPYFTAMHKTPWGEAINYDQPGAEGVRRYFIENALYWIREYHLDGLRLDAVQTIADNSARHIVAEIQAEVQALARELMRTVCVIAETDENDPRYTRPTEAGGYGLDGIWSDDFHHAAHAHFTGERRGYYQDFGRAQQIAKALNDGFVFQGEHFRFWGRPRGASAAEMIAPQHVIALQNHDQVGNRALGERLTTLTARGARMAAAALLLLAPQTPLIFMGQEYDEPAPFQFFSSYGDPTLKKAVSEGRRKEFAQFDWEGVPDPEDPATFARSKLNWGFALRGNNPMLRWYRDLLGLRARLYGAESLELPGTQRTCHAQWHETDGVMTMNVPAQEPCASVVALLRPIVDAHGRRELLARYAPAEAPAGQQRWNLALCADEEGYETRIYTRDFNRHV